MSAGTLSYGGSGGSSSDADSKVSFVFFVVISAVDFGVPTCVVIVVVVRAAVGARAARQDVSGVCAGVCVGVLKRAVLVMAVVVLVDVCAGWRFGVEASGDAVSAEVAAVFMVPLGAVVAAGTIIIAGAGAKIRRSAFSCSSAASPSAPFVPPCCCGGACGGSGGEHRYEDGGDFWLNAGEVKAVDGRDVDPPDSGGGDDARSTVTGGGLLRSHSPADVSWTLPVLLLKL